MTTSLAPVPTLYAQIARQLLREIMAGRLADGQRLPPEREMAAELGVSVGTLRKALAELAEQGLLERVQGSGNYVKAGPEIAGKYAFFRLERPEGGGVPSARLLSLATVRKPAGPAFGVDPRAHRVRRVRYLDEAPAALEEIWLDAGRAPTLEGADLTGALYRVWQERFGLYIVAAEDRVSLGRVPDWAPRAFAPPAGAPCCLVTRRSRAQDGGIVEFSHTWFDSERANYVQRLN